MPGRAGSVGGCWIGFSPPSSKPASLCGCLGRVADASGYVEVNGVNGGMQYWVRWVRVVGGVSAGVRPYPPSLTSTPAPLCVHVLLKCTDKSCRWHV